MSISKNAKKYHERMLSILATLLTCQGTDGFRAMILASLNFEITPVEAKEIVYLSIGRVYPFLSITNEVLHSVVYHSL